MVHSEDGPSSTSLATDGSIDPPASCPLLKTLHQNVASPQHRACPGRIDTSAADAQARLQSENRETRPFLLLWPPDALEEKALESRSNDVESRVAVHRKNRHRSVPPHRELYPRLAVVSLPSARASTAQVQVPQS